MTFSSKVKQFNQDPFRFIDNLNIVLKGNNLNFFQKYKRLRITALGIAILCTVGWIAFGFDSTPLQFFNVLTNGIPQFILGHATWADIIAMYNSYYGKEMHYSAFVFYCLMYWVLSSHFDNAFGITQSKNVAYSASIVFLSIACFEFYWMYSFAYFQHQWWVVTWAMPQLRILLQNLVFLFVGIIGVLHMWTDSFVLSPTKEIIGRKYKLRLDYIAVLLILVSVVTAFMWWNYPWHVDLISVPLKDGTIWTNTPNFPQTLYTVKTDPASSINAGEWFWVENDLIHAWNTLVKFIWTVTIGYIAMVRKHE